VGLCLGKCCLLEYHFWNTLVILFQGSLKQLHLHLLYLFTLGTAELEHRKILRYVCRIGTYLNTTSSGDFVYGTSTQHEVYALEPEIL
jgi:hypothetical protein